MKVSHEYVGAMAILLVSLLKMFNIEVENEAVAGLITGIIAVWIAVRRYNKGDIAVSGVKK